MSGRASLRLTLAISGVLAVAAVRAPAATAQTTDPPLPIRLAIEEQGDASAADILDRAGPLPYRVAVRVVTPDPTADAGLSD